LKKHSSKYNPFSWGLSEEDNPLAETPSKNPARKQGEIKAAEDNPLNPPYQGDFKNGYRFTFRKATPLEETPRQK